MIQYQNDVEYKFIEDETKVLKELLTFLSNKDEGSIVDYILEFCNVNDYKEEEVGELIKCDNFLKQIVELDCISHNIFRTDSPKMGNW